MKIAVVIDTWFPVIGGGQINAWEISRRIVKSGCQIDIITRNNGEYKGEKVKNLNVIQIGSTSNPDANFSRLFFLIRAFFLVRGKKYDVIHLQAFLPGLLAPLVRYFLKKPTIFTVHGTRMFEKNPKPFFGFWLEKIILTKIKYDVQISVTKAFLKFKNVNKQSFSSNKNIKVIGNGIDLKRFAKVKVEKAPYPKILWVGRFDKVKRVDNLIMVMKDVIWEIPEAKLTLVGYGYEENNLKKLTKKLNLNKHVEFAGKKTGDDLIREYKSSHLFVICSDSEGQPLSILEAQAAYLPVVATKTGGIPEIVENNINGLLVPPNDYNSLENAIIWCLKNKNDFGQRGHLKVAKMDSWDDIANKTLSIYRELSK